LGQDPQTGEDVSLRSGRFGPYVQRGEGKGAKRASLPKGWTPESMTFERAMRLINLPREIGLHPETGKAITASIGRFGPYIAHDGAYANLESVEDMFDVGINRAIALLSEKAAKGGRGRAAPAVLATLGEHPDGGTVTVRDGRYGVYVNWDKINATLPKGMETGSVTIEDALRLIAAKVEKTGGSKAKIGKKAAEKKTSAKKATTTKKTSAKKATTKTAAQKTTIKKTLGKKSATQRADMS